MNTNQKPATGRQISVVDQFRRDLERMGPQFSMALPAHIPVERFLRTVMTAIQNEPKLLACSRQSIFNAAMKCAQDGLLPDRREAAIVPFGEFEDGQRKANDQATYLPMIGGIRKKARNSGELSDWYAEVVHVGDEFDYQLGDEPHILHKPALKGGRTRPITHAYSIAKFKDGSISREVMTIDEVEDIRRKYSRSRKGPWNDPVTYPEMVRKTVARLHSKQLPMSSDLDTLLQRDNELYDFKAAREHERGKRGRARSALAALEHFAGAGGAAAAGAEDAAAGDGDANEAADPRSGDDVVIDQAFSPMMTIAALIADAEETPPQTPEQFAWLVNGLLDAAAETADIEMIKTWWTSAAGRGMRNRANMSADDTSALAAKIKALLEAGPLDIPAALRRTAEGAKP